MAKYKWSEEHYEATKQWVDVANKLGTYKWTISTAAAKFKLEQWSVQKIYKDTISLLQQDKNFDGALLFEVWSILGPNFRFNDETEKKAVEDVREILRKRFKWSNDEKSEMETS